jgi:polar amino acid transport system substrate-binding protein
MAHRGFLRAVPDAGLEVIDFGAEGAALAEGAYSFAKADANLLRAFNRALQGFLGSPTHRAIMRRYGFTDADVDRIL